MNTITTDSARSSQETGLRLEGSIDLEVSGRNWKLDTRPPWTCSIIPQGERLLAIPSDASGGLRGGDSVDISVVITKNAQVVWQSPGALLLFPSSAGTEAARPCLVNTRIYVEKGSSLVYLARPAIPCQGSAIVQRSSVSIEVGASLFYQELWSAGRIASGERFEFAYIDSEFRLFEETILRYQEAWTLRGNKQQPPGPAGFANYSSWGMSVATHKQGKSVLENETAIQRTMGFDCITGTLSENLVLSRFGMEGASDRAFKRFVD